MRLIKAFLCMLLTHNWINVYDMRTAQHYVACRRCGIYKKGHEMWDIY